MQLIRIWNGYGEKRLGIGQVRKLVGTLAFAVSRKANSEIMAMDIVGSSIVMDKEIKKVRFLVIIYWRRDNHPTTVPSN